MAEFAEKTGITKQAVYDQMKSGKRLNPYVKKINGKKMIRAEALAFYTNPDEVPEIEPEPEQKETDPILSLLAEQLRAKDEQIRGLTEALKANQTLIYALQNQVARLTGEVAPEDQTEQPGQTAAHEPAPEPVTRTAAPAVEPEKQPEPQPATPKRTTGGLFAWLFGRVRD